MKNIILSSVLLLLIGCNSKNTTETTTDETTTSNIAILTNAQMKNAALEFGKLEKGSISATLKVSGKIDVPPQNMVSISMPLGGYLKSTQLLPGMHIAKGQVIATMEDQQYIQLQQDYLTTKSKLAYAELEFERQRDLNQSQASSDKVFQMADSEYKTLKIILSGLSEKLKLININPNKLSEKNISKSVNLYAPINGFVSRVNVNIGKYVNPSDVLFELIDPSDIHLNLKVFEKDINSIAIGQKLFAYTNTDPAKKYNCEIILISKDLSDDAHSAEVHCHFEKYDKSLLPGMYMNADIEIKNEDALTVPEDAIVNFEGNNYIFVMLKANNFQMTEVTVGNSENRLVQILNPEVIQDKTIVTKGAYTLLMTLKNKATD